MLNKKPNSACACPCHTDPGDSERADECCGACAPAVEPEHCPKNGTPKNEGEPEQPTPPSAEVFRQSVGDALDAADRGDVVPAADVLAELDEAIAERGKTTYPIDDPVFRAGVTGMAECYAKGRSDERARIERIIEAEAEPWHDSHPGWNAVTKILAAIRGGDDA